MKIYFLLLSYFFVSQVSAQENNPRVNMQTTIELEWEVVDGASAYEVELTPKLPSGPNSGTDSALDSAAVSSKPSAQPIRFSTTTAKVSQKVPLGIYSLRIRSKEGASGYFGDWSAPVEIEALAKTIQPIFPPDKSEVASPAERRKRVTFEWTAANDAREYTLRIWSDDLNSPKEFKIQNVQTPQSGRNPRQDIMLTAGKVYHWQVTFESKTNVNYQSQPPTFSFTLLGSQLTTPDFAPADYKRNVQKAKWSASPKAEVYSGALEYHSLDELEWRSLRKLASLRTTEWQLGKLKPGVYRVTVVAHAKNHIDSEPGYHEFVVKPSKSELANALLLTDGLGTNEKQKAPSLNSQ